MAVHVLKPGQSVTIEVVDAHELRPGMRMLESTSLVYGILAEIERIGSTASGASPHCSAGTGCLLDAPSA